MTEHDLIAASVLSGNRNFEARIQQNIKANFLMSPPLVVAFALAGQVDVDLTTEPIGKGRGGRDVYLRDLWPSLKEVREAMARGARPGDVPAALRELRRLQPVLEGDPGDGRKGLQVGHVFHLHPGAAVLRQVQHEDGDPSATSARPGPLAIFGDFVTTDHISPAGAIKPTPPPGSTFRSTASSPRTSTATAPAAATTAS